MSNQQLQLARRAVENSPDREQLLQLLTITPPPGCAVAGLDIGLTFTLQALMTLAETTADLELNHSRVSLGARHEIAIKSAAREGFNAVRSMALEFVANTRLTKAELTALVAAYLLPWHEQPATVRSSWEGLMTQVHELNFTCVSIHACYQAGHDRLSHQAGSATFGRGLQRAAAIAEDLGSRGIGNARAFIALEA